MKYIFIACVVISILCLTKAATSEKPAKELLRQLYSDFKENGFPRLGYYDGAKLVDEIQNIYRNVTTGVKRINLEPSVFTKFNKELVLKNGFHLIKALQIFYKKSLDSFDNVLEELVKIRKQQKSVNLITAQAFMNMYKAISEMNVENEESFLDVVVDLLTILGELDVEAKATMYKLAKKHSDLQKLMEIHEETNFKIKELCHTFTEVTDLPTPTGDLLSKILEPFVTLLCLISLFL